MTRPPRPLLAMLLLSLLAIPASSYATQSVARQWNERLLDAIRHDLARPTVHARNLFHFSIAVYDSWAAYDSVAVPYLLGGPHEPFDGISAPANIKAAREETMSYAAYRLLSYRFASSPGAAQSQARFDSLLDYLGYDKN